VGFVLDLNMSTEQEIQKIKINSLKDLESWLEKNHGQKESIWLVYKKKSMGGLFAIGEIIDILLCYGWIDSVSRSIDNIWTSVRISPRKPKSNWSKVNKDKILLLESKGLIKPSGYKTIEIAKTNGCWSALDQVESLILPNDFLEFLESCELIKEWNLKPRSFKRGFLEQLLNSKRPETRQKKFLEIQKNLL
jgi:uncharacterized protein YdeI (YjbR/CyaY-like superfamily)